MSKKLSRGILIVFIANIINLLFNMLSNLFLPKYLSVDTYALIKSYQLYLSYVGILHFGYNDGIYLQYGGKNFENTSSEEMSNNLSILRIFQLIIMFIGLIFSLILKSSMFILVTLAILPTNMISYFQFLFQACGEFKIYGKILNCVSVGTFLINMILLFIINTDNYIIYLLGYIGFNCFMCLVLERLFYKMNGNKISLFYFSFKKLYKTIKDGILLTLGNFSSILMTTMDRLFVKGLIGNIGFAQYSFAVSMENFLNVAITPITVTLYNHFCIKDSKRENTKIRELVIVFSSIIISAAFPISFILEFFLENYLPAKNIIFLLFGSQMFYIVIKAIYINLYKARKQQNAYFIKMLIVMFYGLIINIFLFIILRNKEAFAIGTLSSAIFWLVLCIWDYRDMKLNEIVYLILELVLFLILGNFVEAVIGFIIYIISTFIFICIFLPSVKKYCYLKLKSS